MSITAFWYNCRQYIPAFRRKRLLCLDCCNCLKFKSQTHFIFISRSFFVIVVWSNCWSYFFILPWHLKTEECYIAQVYFEKYTAWKVSVFAVFFVRILPHSAWIRRDTEYLSIFSPNAGKYGTEKLWIQTLFMYWYIRITYGIQRSMQNSFKHLRWSILRKHLAFGFLLLIIFVKAYLRYLNWFWIHLW